MNNQLIFLKEPQLLFKYEQRLEDPRDGLTLFGPYEQLPAYSIQAGVVGTLRGLNLYQEFVRTLQRPIFSTRADRPTLSIQRPTFPGFEAVFAIQWPQTPVIKRVIDPILLEKKVANPNVNIRTYELVSLYLDEIKRAYIEEEARIDLWFVIVPQRIWHQCRVRSDSQRLPVSSGAIQAYRRGQKSLFSEFNEAYEEASKILDTSSDFHHQLKARILQEKIGIPIQILLEPTLKFKDKYRGWEYEDEMKAFVAWTQSSTTYYKLGKLPWKLADIRKGVCYIGLVFKRYERVGKKGYACSAAQMFLDSGDGTVFRGNIGPWESRDENEFHLDKESAKELVALAMQSYYDKRGEYPVEVFIHGRAGFAAEEWDGFKEVVSELNPETNLVGVTIRDSGKLKLFRDVEGELCRYGNLRGLGLIIDKREGFLWTRGFVPRLTTSTSLEIPNPLRIKIDKGEGDIEQIFKDILALSKLNYNACLYGDGLPVTLRFSDLIGSILTAVDSIESKVLPFKYYI